MALPREYVAEDCPIARTLEIVGERWTLLLLRDAFYGVSRFSDFREHMGIPRAVLTERLNLLVEHGILARATAASGRDEYTLTAKGEALWPTIWSLICWGNDYYTDDGRQRRYTHADCGGEVPADGVCAACGARPLPRDLTVHPRPWARAKTDPVSVAMSVPHRLLTPITRTSAPA
jgi:DNA-binding HxlR family transcriptional regulator